MSHRDQRAGRRGARRVFALVITLAAVVLTGAFVGRGLLRRGNAAAEIPVETIERRDIAVTIEATGVVEPIDMVEVKSKASGQILHMPVEVGSRVRTGDLIAQIDTVDVQNAYEQALAAERAAQARADVARAQKDRADALYAQQITTITEHETAVLGFAEADAQLVKARTDLDTARQRRDDATVRAPIAGTVLEQLVSTGQVISSATASVSGGTSLLKMADLSRIRVRAYVSETDIGHVRTGQEAKVSFEAYSQRVFAGKVEKIEPQAVVQQSVTMFPVLVSIDNEEGLLLPGMNGDVSMTVDERAGVPAVSLDAVRALREISSAVAALGMDRDSVAARLAREARRIGGANPPQVAFVRTGRGFELRLVRLGLSDYDYAQVTDGLKEGDQVALLSVAELAAQRKVDQARIRERMGNGIPGSSGSSGTSGSRRSGGSASSGGTGSSGSSSSSRSSAASQSKGNGTGDWGPPPPPPGGP